MPTGMNTGVFTVQCGKVRSQALALVTGHSAKIRKVRGAKDEAFLEHISFVLISLMPTIPICSSTLQGAAILDGA